ncbi:MAG: DUF1343 domain-containing protein [Saprospiraceae bacterium]|nr:DUF1343 domain-containing protein [Saprospiraceae bacterium]
MNIFCAITLLLSLLNCEAYRNKQQLKTWNDRIESASDSSKIDYESPLQLGAERLDEYLPLIHGQKVGLVVNQTSMVGDVHLVDLLLKNAISVEKVFAPEHGFRGTADAGEKVNDGIDVQTGLPIISLYGKNKKPYPEQLTDIDVLIFDIQDVGARFYTYISTMHYVMEAAAEHGKQVIILDRPNPNGHYVDGPVLQPAFKSFVGMHEVPVVHAMTIGEYAQMINGEGWLAKGIQCDLTVIPMEGYTHSTKYELPVKPSPNLPNATSIALYPSLCFFEGTTLSVGRGTNKQFQIVGHPKLRVSGYMFTPQPMPGAKYPKLEGQLCKGWDLSGISPEENDQLDLSYLIHAFKDLTEQDSEFFLKNNFFDKLAGSDQLRLQILEGIDIESIRQSWQSDIEQFQSIRSKYLIYPE